MHFVPDHLILVKESSGINKAEPAPILNVSAMGYDRYEKAEPGLFLLVELTRQDENLLPRLLEYAKLQSQANI
jgi:hypothetical protein